MLTNELDVIDVIDANEPKVKTNEWKKAEWRAQGISLENMSDLFLTISERKSTASYLAIGKRII